MYTIEPHADIHYLQPFLPIYICTCIDIQHSQEPIQTFITGKNVNEYPCTYCTDKNMPLSTVVYSTLVNEKILRIVGCVI